MPAASVPLRQVASFNVVLEPGIQWRRDRLPSITVRGVVPDDVQSPDVANAVFAKLKPLRDPLPAGYTIELQGAVEESAKSQASINEKMPVMLLVILLLLMVQLQHFGKTLLVLVTGPLGLIGAAAALLVFQAPVRLRRHPRRHRARRHHHAQQRDPGGSDRSGHGGRARCVQRYRRIGGPPLRPIMLTAAAAVLAYPARRRGFLGADGAGHDGRADCGDHIDADVPAGALRPGFPGPGAAS